MRYNCPIKILNIPFKYLGTYYQFEVNCRLTNEAYAPFFDKSSQWVPCSISSPFLITRILSQLIMVESLWATIIIVIYRLPTSPSIAFWTWYSLSASRAEVASSNIIIFGSLAIQRAILLKLYLSLFAVFDLLKVWLLFSQLKYSNDLEIALSYKQTILH